MNALTLCFTIAIGAALLACNARVRPPSTQAAGGIPTSACDTVAVDTDVDGLSDRCELMLARALAPILVAGERDCLWEPGPSTEAPRLSGAYLFAVQRVGGDTVRLAYLPAYALDCGWSGAARALRFGRTAAHSGDSEFVAVDLLPHGGVWRVSGVFYSSHCLGRSAGRCRWYRGAALGAIDWRGPGPGPPKVWVALGKHAHYPTRADCERGHWSQERCASGRDARAYVFPVLSERQNVGSRARPAFAPGGCLRATELPLPIRDADSSAVECVWDDARPFRGWQGAARGTPPTPYGRLLRELLGM
jgi:hypothetical protein